MSIFAAQPREKRKVLVKAIVERMAQAYGVRRSALPDKAGCSANVMNNWVYYGRIPYEEIHDCQQRTGVTLNWLLYGEAPRPRLSKPELTALIQMTARLLDDGVEYQLMTEQCAGAVDMLMAKYEKTLNQWSNGGKDSNIVSISKVI